MCNCNPDSHCQVLQRALAFPQQCVRTAISQALTNRLVFQWVLFITEAEQAFTHLYCSTYLYFFVRGLSIPSHFLSSHWFAITVNRYQSRDGATLRQESVSQVSSPSPDFSDVFLFYNEHFGHFGYVCGGEGGSILGRDKDEMKEETITQYNAETKTQRNELQKQKEILHDVFSYLWKSSQWLLNFPNSLP